MQITINSQLQPQVNNRTHDLSYQIPGLAYSQHALENGFKYKVIQGNLQTTLVNSGLIGLLSHCYSKHLPVAIAPHDIWVMLLSQISKEVAANTEQYREFFTTSKGKETISVPSGSMTEMPMEVLAKALQEKVLFDSNIIFPGFSTQTPIVTETIQAIFCDMASPYYDYMMFCCGIPAVELLGTPEDWQKLLQGFTEVVNTFKTASLDTYLKKVQPILEQCVNASQGQVDTDFWKDIFTQKNIGSGGDLSINGWITKLFIKDNDGSKITNFISAFGIVKYTQAQTKEEFVAVYGGFDTKVNSKGFYELEYSKYIVQKVAI